MCPYHIVKISHSSVSPSKQIKRYLMTTKTKVSLQPVVPQSLLCSSIILRPMPYPAQSEIGQWMMDPKWKLLWPPYPDTIGFIVVEPQGHGHHACDPESVWLLAHAAVGSEKQLNSHSCCKTAPKESPDAFSNSFAPLAEEDNNSDANDLDFKLGDLLALGSGYESGESSDEDGEDCDKLGISNAKVGQHLFFVCQTITQCIKQLAESLPSKTIPQQNKKTHQTHQKKEESFHYHCSLNYQWILPCNDWRCTWWWWPAIRQCIHCLHHPTSFYNQYSV